MSWDKMFEKKNEVTEPDIFIKEFYRKFKGELNIAKVLDLGCGTGRHTIFFAEKGLEVFAIDKTKVALDILREKLKSKYRVKLTEASPDNMPYPDKFFDVIVSTIVLHHGTTNQIKMWFEEIRRKLKIKGLLAISVLSAEDKRFSGGREIETNTRLDVSDLPDSQEPHHFFTKEEIEKLLKDFSILEISESERNFAKGFGKAKYWDIIARKL